MDLMKAVKILSDEYNVDTDEHTIELLLELLNKYGSLNNVLKEGTKQQYQFLKKRSKIIAMLGDDLHDDEYAKADALINYIHALNREIQADASTTAWSYDELLQDLKLKETLDKCKEMSESSDEIFWVLTRLGGKEFIKKINFQEPNQLRKNVKYVFDQYTRIPPEKRHDLALENNPNMMKSLIIKRS